ncbi:Hypothetical predicted protein [Olea europaea subsp. europaea]|uniref:Uncharacterized protein n=1 Tax=Olea europaea subsp. europaea TaxID=158383 RepID=A0A8S0QTN1_OLEEU|nr:Hypothetical predicted protein [Olea europaea subsp. europaea]
MLWDEGVYTCDMQMKQNFQLKAALMWTISDFPGYGVLSGWNTHRLKSCPYCMVRTKSFRLKNRGKTSFLIVIVNSYHSTMHLENKETSFTKVELRRIWRNIG